MTIISHDLVDETMPYVQSGVITATIGQDPYGQGHDLAVHLFNHLAAGWQPPTSRLLTPSDLVTSGNIGQFWQAGKGAIESAEMAARRPKPMKAAPRRFRIAVLGIEEIARELEGATARFKLTREDKPTDAVSGGPAEARVAEDGSRGRSRKAA
jgi:hypothetical protein